METPTQVVNKAPEYWKRLEDPKVKEAQRLWYWYYNEKDKISEYIQEAMRKMFRKKTIARMNIRIFNIVGKVIDKIALVYKNNPERMLDGGKKSVIKDGKDEITQTDSDKIYQEKLEKSTISRKQTEWHKLGKLFNTVLVQPVHKEEAGKDPYIDFLIHTPAWCIVETSDTDYLRAKAFYYPILKKLTADGPEEKVLVYWSEKDHYYIDQNGNKIAPKDNPKMENPYKILPVAILRMKEGINFWGNGLWDLVDGNEEACIQVSNICYVAIFQAHGQPLAINLGLTGEPAIGPDKPIKVENAKREDHPPDFRFAKADPLIGPVQGLVDWFLKTIQTGKGLGPQQYTIDSNDMSGISKIVDSAEIQEMRQDDLAVLQSFEYDLFSVLKAVINFHSKSRKIADDAKFSVNFPEPKVIETTDEIIKKDAAGLENGTLSRVDIIMRNYKCTREEAVDKLKLIIQENREFNDEYGALEKIGATGESEPANETPEEKQKRLAEEAKLAEEKKITEAERLKKLSESKTTK